MDPNVETSVDVTLLSEKIDDAEGGRKTLNLTDRRTQLMDSDFQRVADRLARLKDPSPSILTPSNLDGSLSTSRWSDRREDDNPMFQNLQDSILVARNRYEAKGYGEPKSDLPKGQEAAQATEDPPNPSFIVEGGREEMRPQRGGGNPNFRGGRGGRGQGGGRGQAYTRTWADVAASSTRSSVPLRYVPPNRSEGYVSVNLPTRPNPLEKWDSCLVGYFLDKGVSYNYLKNSAFGLWKNKGLKEVLANGEGFSFFIFDNPECCTSLLEGGPWYIGGFNLFLKKWTRMMKLSKEKATKVPVWAKFFNVPFEYWDSDGLSRIASAVGVPLFMDQLTEQGSRVSFARVCVEVEAASTLPAMFKVDCEGIEATVKVEYQGLPPKCDHCIAFGHDTARCVKTQVAALINIQKEVQNHPDPSWETVMAKGKRKVGVPETTTETVNNEEPIEEGLPQSGEEQNHPEIQVQVETAVELSDQTHREVLNPTEVESKDENMEDLVALQKELVKITSLVLPHDTGLLAKVENLVESTPGKFHTGKQAQAGSSAKGNSSGKGNKSQRKKRRGFNNPHRHKEVRKFLLNEDIKILGILETKIKALNEQQIFSSGVNNWPFLTNSQPSKTGRICVCWDSAFCKIQKLHESDQYIFCEVHDLTTDYTFRVCFVYAENKHEVRKEFFESMVNISQAQSNIPLVILGDFNAIRFPYEKSGGSTGWSKDKEEFNSCILQAELVDLSYGGCQFTWANKRTSGDYIASKIDRVLVNEAWLDAFPASFATFLPSGISDHSPAVVHISDKVTSFKKPFKYFDFWADHEDFSSVVSTIWNQYIQGVPMFRVCQKLKNLKPALKALNKKDFSDITTRVHTSRSELLSAQCKLDKDPSNTSLQQLERTFYKKYVDLLVVEESLAHQKSRVQWLSQGDSNSRFFFKTIKGNINRGKILSLEMMDGKKSSEPKDIHNAFIDFFSGLFGTPIDDHYNGFDRVQSLVKSKISSDQSLLLASPVTDKEIKDTFWSLKANKAPGPDGFSAGFFKSAWNIVGREVTQAVRTFFESGRLLSEVNSTIIALIPKVPNPVKVGDFRPISCCNTIYKCIAKIIANRIKTVLPDLVDPVQSAFVQGRKYLTIFSYLRSL
ncbi:uncharacterized protein LOC114291701 [Camellia sinensis]|uniref:uncharacterized protein LOC114291701 n=1 Tax=Camellia sinensis TaxID=4442 RepID=UPI0010365D58|nr:uncharacterized protein LOC114291701 [Camellia sinensis]